MDALNLIKTRRSTRRFQARAVENEKLDAIIDAGRHAPSGSNSQTTHFLVITDKNVLSELAVMVKQEFSTWEITPNMYRSMVKTIKASQSEHFVFHYNAPVLIVTANKKDYTNNMADCACALENMMLMANALDLGSCWINQLKWLNECEAVNALFRKYGLAEDERIYGAVSIGYADTEDGLPSRNPLPRTGNPVTYI